MVLLTQLMLVKFGLIWLNRYIDLGLNLIARHLYEVLK